MKKIKYLFGLVCILVFTQCGKKNVEWITPGYEYELISLVTPGPDGIPRESLQDLFPGADRVTFTKNYTGFLGDGAVNVYRTDFQTATYSDYNVVYNPYTGCYDYEWYDYDVSWSNTEVNSYKFNWRLKTQDGLEIDFSDYSYNQNTLRRSFWEFLSNKYTVKKETRLFGTWYAEIITLKFGTIEIVLRRRDK